MSDQELNARLLRLELMVQQLADGQKALGQQLREEAQSRREQYMDNIGRCNESIKREADNARRDREHMKATIDHSLQSMAEMLATVRADLAKTVTAERLKPIELISYGLVGSVLLAVLGLFLGQLGIIGGTGS